MRKQYKSAIIVLVALLFVGLTNSTHAAGPATFFIRTDRPSYVPGDMGTLLITIRNVGSQAFTIKNLTITFSWLAYLNDHWDGNYTITGIGKPIATNQVYNTQQSFSVPNDGRAASLGFASVASVTVTAGTDIGGGGRQLISQEAAVGIATATYQPIGVGSSLLEIISLALLAVAVIVLALVFLSIRKMAKK